LIKSFSFKISVRFRIFQLIPYFHWLREHVGVNIGPVVLWLRHQIDLVLQNLVGLRTAKTLAALVVFPPVDLLLLFYRVQLPRVATMVHIVKGIRPIVTISLIQFRVHALRANNL